MNYLVIDCFNFTMIGASVSLGMSRNSGSNFEETLKYLLNKMINKLIREFPGYEVYGVWDTFGGTDFRKELVPEYKANRDHSQFDFRVIQSMEEVFKEYGVINISVPKCEADDGIYLLCKIIKEKDNNGTVVIVSRDEDMVQVVQSGYADRIWDVTKKEFREIPEYSIIDMKALVGDKSDNIKGVDGIGPKTALKIMSGTKLLTEEQKLEFEKYKSIIDFSKNPRIKENYEYLKGVIR